MNKGSDSVYLKLSAFICAVIILLDVRAFSGVLSSAPPFTAAKAYASVNANESVQTVQNSEESGEKPEKSEEKVAASGDEVAIGEIQNRYISPYTAGTSYNNVYLKNSTGIDIDIKQLLGEALNFKIEKNAGPQVLIVHSHATECFMSEDRSYYTASDLTRTTDKSENVVAVGKVLAKKLNDAGIVTLHSEVLHDYPDYNYSYTNSAKTVKEYLEKYPGIKIILDMHRDAIGGDKSRVKVTSKVNGKQAAQVMLVMGSGTESSTAHPNYRENLKLAVRFQQTMEILYPGLARAISFVPYEYNQSLHTGSMLIEMGTAANSLEEVKYSAELVGEALISLCNTLS